MPDAEVLIVGGGPAGSAAAIACAQAGLRVVLVERDSDAREKPGEGLHPGVESVLRELGVADRLPEVTGARFPGVWVGWGEAPRFEAFGADQHGPWLGYQVRRASFDGMLRAQASALGAEVLRDRSVLEPITEHGKVVGARLDSGPMRAAMLIDASGPARWLARKLALPARESSPRRSLRYGYMRGACAARDEAPALIGDADGWTWTAKVGDGIYQWARLAFDAARPIRDEAPEEFASLERIGTARGADATWRVMPSAGPGWMLAGDAAATLDPTSSKGVLKALLSGFMAGRTAAAILRRGADAARGAAAYRRWMEDGFDTEVAALAPLMARLGATGFGRAE